MTATPDDDAWLIALANDVSDGKPVDWTAVIPPGAGDATRRLVAELRRVASVVEAHRGGDQPSAPEPDQVPPDSPGAWQHLVLLQTVGQGAFGTVYRAWDAQLDREVALKVLLQAPLGAPLEEARNLARIRHPNVVAVYGAEQVGDQVGIWMEFIEGETLASVVRERGPMSAREVSGIGIDLCQALSALHRSGLLHGDIKAHNVMRETGGRLVLMDFSGVQAAEGSATPAISGTPLYIAPEVFEGRPASFTSDIYSLGVLLFYLLSGHYPVEGADVNEIRRLHTGGERVRLRDIRPEVPDPVVQIVERAAAADPAARFHTVGELEHALAGIFAAHGARGAMSRELEESAVGRGRSRSARWALGLATLATLIAAAAVWWALPARAPAAPLVRLMIGPPFNSGSWPRVSPDGRTVVFGTTIDGHMVLWLRSMDTLQGRALKQAETSETPFWSPDSRRLAFFAGGRLKTVELSSGNVENLTEAQAPHGGDWNSAGVLIFAAAGGIVRVSASGADRSIVVPMDEASGDYQCGWPEFLPDGRRFLYVVRSRVPERTGVYVGSLDSTMRRKLMPAYSRVAYSPTGHLLFVRNYLLTAQPFDAGTATFSGEPVEIASGVKFHLASDAAFDVSSTGILVYRANEGLPATRLTLFDRTGHELRELTGTGFFRHPRFSPDGTRIATEEVQGDAPNPDLWLLEPASQRAARLTSHVGPDIRPTWSPDGRRLAFSSKRATSYDLYVKTLDVLEEEQVLWKSETDKMVEDWSPDGKTLTVTVLRSGLWRYSLDPKEKPALIRPSFTAETWQSEFSPDGHWLAYMSTESGRAEVYVEPIPATGARWQVSANGGAEPHWRRDSGELFYLTLDQWIAAAAVPATGSWSMSAPNRLFHVTIPEVLGGSDFAVGPQGQMVVNVRQAEQAIPPIEVVVNWTELLGKP